MAAGQNQMWIVPLLRGFVTLGVYKRSQGRVVRQATFGAIAVAVAVGCWQMSVTGTQWGSTYRYGIPLVVLVAGLWAAFRIVNYPPFADFLISVEAEMAKVSWPTWPELVRGATVVMATIFALAGILYLYDVIWKALLTAIGVAGGGG